MAIRILTGAESVFEGSSKRVNHTMNSITSRKMFRMASCGSIETVGPHLYPKKTADRERRIGCGYERSRLPQRHS